jgi:hypothetical protein
MEGDILSEYNAKNHIGVNDTNNDSTTIEQAISFMGDQHALVIMDRMTAYMCGASTSPSGPFPFILQEKESVAALGESLAKRLNPFLRRTFQRARTRDSFLTFNYQTLTWAIHHTRNGTVENQQAIQAICCQHGIVLQF